MSGNFPYFSDILIKGAGKNIGIATLWTRRDIIARDLEPGSYAVIGSLFYNEGINYIIRSVFLNPEIRYIILCGTDISRSGEAFVKFMENGIDANHKIVGTEYFLEKEIPLEAIEEFRKNIKLLDMRGVINGKEVAAKIKELEPLTPFTEKKEFPMPEMKPVEKFPSEEAGFLVRDSFVAGAWLKALNCIMRFGFVKKSEHSSDQRELINLMIVVEEEDTDNPQLKEWLPFGKAEIENYLPQVMTPEVPKGTDYTYGNKLRDYKGRDQIKFIIDYLKKRKHTRRALAVTWDHEQDMGSEHPPCWVVLQALVEGDTLFLTTYIRSSDMFAAWPLNAFGLRNIHKEIADGVGLKLGPTTTISASAHIYEHDWKKAQDILEKYHKPVTTLRFDPRGNFIISLDREKQELVITHYSPKQEKLQDFRAKNAIEAYRKLNQIAGASDFEHIADLGVELAKAEIALKHGLKYSQDDELDINAKAE
ncbi:MAG: hypothetical protein HY514_00830 [Candidatus Aenigmarchaeota archaeon]|nr:hypothetical protein [Candidatus Aenigmarchaeota archaeon]